MPKLLEGKSKPKPKKSKKRREEEYTVTTEGLDWLEHYVLAAEISLIKEHFGDKLGEMLLADKKCSEESGAL